MAQYKGKGHQLKNLSMVFLKRNRDYGKYTGRPELSTERLYRTGALHPPNDESSCTTACGNDPSTLVVRPERAEG